MLAQAIAGQQFDISVLEDSVCLPERKEWPKVANKGHNALNWVNI